MAKTLTKLAFSFDSEDKELLDRAKEQLKPSHGSLSNMAVLRIVLRAYLNAQA